MWVTTSDLRNTMAHFFFFLQDELPCWVNHGVCTFLDITHSLFLPQLFIVLLSLSRAMFMIVPKSCKKRHRQKANALWPHGAPGILELSQCLRILGGWYVETVSKILQFFFWDSVFYRLGWPRTRDYSTFLPSIGITDTCCHIQLCWLL